MIGWITHRRVLQTYLRRRGAPADTTTDTTTDAAPEPPTLG